MQVLFLSIIAGSLGVGCPLRFWSLSPQRMLRTRCDDEMGTNWMVIELESSILQEVVQGSYTL